MENATKNPLLDPGFLRKLEHLALIARRVQLGVTKGERRSKRKGSSIEFADYRDYVQGDDLRHVDWNIAARLNTLYLKLFQEQEDLTLHLLIDASTSMAYGDPAKLDFACKMAAAIGYIALVGFDRLSVEAFSSDQRSYLPACRGKASAGKLFSFLEGVRAGGGTALEDSCRSYLLRNRAKGVAVLLSDFLDPAGYEGCLRRLCMAGSDLYVIQMLSPEEVDPDVSGDLRLIDCETEAYTEISMSPSLVRRYKKNLDTFRESLRQACLARGIGYIFATSDTPFEQLTLEVLRRGGMLK